MHHFRNRSVNVQVQIESPLILILILPISYSLMHFRFESDGLSICRLHRIDGRVLLRSPLPHDDASVWLVSANSVISQYIHSL